jgi:hypothetical protein
MIGGFCFQRLTGQPCTSPLPAKHCAKFCFVALTQSPATAEAELQRRPPRYPTRTTLIDHGLEETEQEMEEGTQRTNFM